MLLNFRVTSLRIASILLILSALPQRSAAAQAWTLTGRMHTARYSHSAVLLADGRVLVAGGIGEGGVLPSSEVYDPNTGRWTVTGDLNQARAATSAVLLANGRVLVAGGCVNFCETPTASAELYDPGTGRWTETGSLNTARYAHTAVLLNDGKVLVAGGCTSTNCASNTASAELYDPDSGQWSVTGSLNQARDLHTATLLSNGSVVVAGGFGVTKALASSEIYDPAAGTWMPAGNLQMNRMYHTANLLLDGTVLVAGGKGGPFGDILCTSEIFDPNSKTWTLATTMKKMVENHTATLTREGRVLVAGGDSIKNINGEIVALKRAQSKSFDPSTARWTITGQMNQRRTQHTATRLAKGQVLVTGGLGTKKILASAELYKP